MQERHPPIIVIDFGSQYSHLITRRVRDLRVYCELWSSHRITERFDTIKPKGIILSGGPASANAPDAPHIPDAVFACGCPILAICYGMQRMIQQEGGSLSQITQREFGRTHIDILAPCILFEGITWPQPNVPILDVWMSHGDHVTNLPESFVTVAKSTRGTIAAISHREKPWYGLQFHPEVSHTEQGTHMLKQFLYTVCQCQKDWVPQRMMEACGAGIEEKVGRDRVILGLSGGVDSSVAALLLHRILGDQLICIFVDHGLMRRHETKQVMDVFAAHFKMNVIQVDAKNRFYSALEGISDAEEKRKVIGRLFVEVFEEQAKRLENIRWLAQGTIYPDVVESAGGESTHQHLIKSHHNVGGLPERLRFQLIEPLRLLFKDEVRQLGELLGLPSHLIWRHPFPGPGLGVRMLGAIIPQYIPLLQKADAIFIEELHAAGWYTKVSQAFAVLLPVQSVGVAGDCRHVGPVIALRAVETSDFMTARWAHLPHALLERVSLRIVNEVQGISRVVYDVTGKPPATIEWE